MKSLLKWLAGIAFVGGLVVALTTWPLIHDVETGKSPEYPDLRVKEYAATPDRVAKALDRALAGLPGWEVVGSGRGQASHSLQAVHTLSVVPLREEVSVRIWREGEKTRVSVRSRSRTSLPDLGQNARNIRELQAALDRELS
ncbi:MAG TPA: DUF1499 domain-containing protein [Vicinamibacteria bacterium]